MTRRVIVLGSGKRVRETALPAFHRARDHFRVERVLARTEKTLEVEGERYDVGAFDDLDPDTIQDGDLIYMVVAKNAAPAVLERLATTVASRVELLIDTPVVRFRHFHATRHLEAFRRVSVAEDCAFLPWIPLVHRLADDAAGGSVQRVRFERSAYAYHGVASSRAILRATRVKHARRTGPRGGAGLRKLVFEVNGGSRLALQTEPRDYTTGCFEVRIGDRTLGDSPKLPENDRLTVEVEGDVPRAIRAGRGEVVPLRPIESELMAGDPPEATLTQRMQAQKRVGFLRLLERLAAGELAHPLPDALEDTVVDYALEKCGRYRSTPLTDPRRSSARFWLRAGTRALDRS